MSHPSNSGTVFGMPTVTILLLMLVYLTHTNIDIFLYINAWAEVLPGSVWAHITTFGDSVFVLALMLPLAVRYPLLAWALIVAAVSGGLINSGLKELFYAARPPSVLPLEQFNLYGPAHMVHSFPSGHTVSAWIMAALLFSYFNGSWRWLVLIMAFLVGISRIALGVHWPMDVLAGMALGWLFGFAGLSLAKKWPLGLKLLPRLLILLFLLIATVYLYWYNNGHPVTFAMQYAAASICLLLVAVQIPALRRQLKGRANDA